MVEARRPYSRHSRKDVLAVVALRERPGSALHELHPLRPRPFLVLAAIRRLHVRLDQNEPRIRLGPLPIPDLHPARLHPEPRVEYHPVRSAVAVPAIDVVRRGHDLVAMTTFPGVDESHSIALAFP